MSYCKKAFSALTLLVERRKGIQPVKIKLNLIKFGVVICLERGADCLQTVQLMPLPRVSAGFWLGRSMPPCRLKRRKFWKSDYKMVQSEVYLNKYVVSIVPFSTPAFTPNSENCSFCIFSLFNLSSIFPGGSQLTLFAPMCGRHYIPKTPLALASFKSRLVLHFWYRLT